MKIPIQLNKEGKITRFGSKWRLSSVYRILTHPGYKGEHPSGIKMPSIIDEANWELAQLRSFVSKIGAGLDPLDFRGRQELLRTLIEKVLYNGQNIEIQTIIPPRGQLHPIHRGGLRG